MHINEKTGLYENYGAWHVPFWQTNEFLFWLKVGLITFGLVAVLCCVYAYIKYTRTRRYTPSQKALFDIQQLKDNHFLYAENSGKLYSSLSYILKQYLFDQFGYEVFGKTDAEVVLFLQKQELESFVVGDIKELLDGAVFVKFANAQVVQDRIDKDYFRIISIIHATVPQKNK